MFDSAGGVGVGESATTEPTASAIVPAAGTPTADSPVATPTSGQGAACEVGLEHISDLVILDDGAEATLSGAYVVTGLQLADRLESLAARGGFDLQSQWRYLGDEQASLCFVDGSFTTTLPGPPGHDTGAERAIVIVAHAEPEPSSAGAREDIPVEDLGIPE